MSETTDRPWWEDVQHLRPQESGTVADGAKQHAPTGRFRRATAPLAEAREMMETRELVAETGRRPKVDFDFDAGLASLLDPPAKTEEPGRFEWIDLGADHAPATESWLNLDEETSQAKPLDDQRAWLTDDDRASGWDLDDWTVSEPPPPGTRKTIEIRGQADGLAGVPAVPAARASGVPAGAGRRRPSRSPADRLAGRPDRIALYAFLLGLLLIAIAAIGTPKANAATIDTAAAAQQAPALVVTVDAAQH